MYYIRLATSISETIIEPIIEPLRALFYCPIQIVDPRTRFVFNIGEDCHIAGFYITDDDGECVFHEKCTINLMKSQKIEIRLEDVLINELEKLMMKGDKAIVAAVDEAF